MDIVLLSWRVPGRKENDQLKKMLILLSERETTVQFNFSWENMVLYHCITMS